MVEKNRMKFSLIIPSFNQAQFLPDNLLSIRQQKNVEVEYIVVDPGSTDGSTDIALAEQRAIVINEPDRGQSHGICKGFERASGDILAWLNSDDYYFANDTLETVLKVFQDNPDVDIVYGGVDFVGENREFLRRGFVNPDSENLFETFPYQVGIVQPGVFWRKRVYEELGGPSEDFNYCMDYEYWVRMAAAGFKWHYVPKTLSAHRWWGGMKTSSRRDLSLVEHFKVGLKYFGYIHWKWLDRYADYLISNEDGIVNRSDTVDEEKKQPIISEVIKQFVTQESMKNLENSSDPEKIKTLEYIHKYSDLRRVYFETSEIDVVSISPNDELSKQRCAWHVFNAQVASGEEFLKYSVPNNFDRSFSKDWYEKEIEHSQSAFNVIKSSRNSDTCVIVGNGPSLNKTDLSLLDGVDTIISNFAGLSPELQKHATFLTVVNDLVAKQGTVSFNATNITKVVPFWLVPYINSSDSTFFVNATVKPEFSLDFVRNASWRSTVSFFNMQLAYALGYKKVLLIGFDNTYIDQKGLKEGDLLTQKNEDPNHFDPRYFKDKVWQAADTSAMEEMYKLAKESFEADGRKIINCTVGGNLEVFKRSSLKEEVFVSQKGKEVSVETLVENNKMFPTDQSTPFKDFPNLLLFDMTQIGNGTATGEVKAALLGGYPKEKLCQLYSAGMGKLGFWNGKDDQVILFSKGQLAGIESAINAFLPDVILFRPTPNTKELHDVAMYLIRKLEKPLVTWIMDDWPENLRFSDHEQYQELNKDFRHLVKISSKNLSISEKMSRAFERRYDAEFIPLANGVNLEEWERGSQSSEPGLIRIRYCGSLASNMGLNSLIKFARVVEKIGKTENVIFEITTNPIWKENEKYFKNFKSTTFSAVKRSRDEYIKHIQGADIAVIAYNFDEASLIYTQYSFANKLPECLAAAVTIAFGPNQVCSIEYLKSLDCAAVVDNDCENDLEVEILKLVRDPNYREFLNSKAKAVVAENHNLAKNQQLLNEVIQSAFTSSKDIALDGIENFDVRDTKEVVVKLSLKFFFISINNYITHLIIKLRRKFSNISVLFFFI